MYEDESWEKMTNFWKVILFFKTHIQQRDNKTIDLKIVFNEHRKKGANKTLSKW